VSEPAKPSPAPSGASAALPTPSQPFDAARALQLARDTFDIEARALLGLKGRTGENFGRVCEAVLACRGRVVVMGMGKSGHVGRKIAATLASTGTPAFFLHAAEALHGDLGMVERKDLLLAISNSGETAEILELIPIVKRLGMPLIAMTGRRDSTLGRAADVVLDVSVAEEACPLGLAPTASTTAALVMGDALAIALLEARGFTDEDFARSHPAGHLGRRLLLHISDIMHTGEKIPCIGADASLSAALMEMTRKGLGMTAIVDTEQRLLGVFTDGDLRRAVDNKKIDLRTTPVTTLMTQHPKTITGDKLAIEAAGLMEAHKIHALLVVDTENRVIGALNIHDLLRARVV